MVAKVIGELMVLMRQLAASDNARHPVLGFQPRPTGIDGHRAAASKRVTMPISR